MRDAMKGCPMTTAALATEAKRELDRALQDSRAGNPMAAVRRCFKASGLLFRAALAGRVERAPYIPRPDDIIDLLSPCRTGWDSVRVISVTTCEGGWVQAEVRAPRGRQWIFPPRGRQWIFPEHEGVLWRRHR
jgi:hypothetical protein